MSKELIGSHSVHETLVRQTQIDAARIEELERERDALQADNARLREAMKEIRDDFDCDNDAHRYGATCRCCLAEKTLAATPEQSLAEYRNKLIEECYNALQKVMVTDHSLRTYKRCLDAIHAMKEPE